MRRALLAVGITAALVLGGVRVFAAVTGETAACDPSPTITRTDTGLEFSTHCSVPLPDPVTVTAAPVTVTAAPVTITVTPTPTPTPTQAPTTTAPSSAPPASDTPIPTPTPTATSTPATGFPDASNTGVPAGTVLTTYTGPSRITTANTVITGKNLGCIEVAAAGVVIRNSHISCAGSAVEIDDRTSTATVLTLEDSEIDCKNVGGTGVTEADYTLTRVNIHGCENGLDVNQNVTITDSYIHDLVIGGHEDGIQLAQYYTGSGYATGARNVTIRHNTIFGAGANGSLGTSAIISNRGSGDTNITIDGNLLGGGAYTLYCPGGTGTNIKVTGNHFTKKYSARYGAYGPSDSCSDEGTVSGNVDDDTGNTLHLD